MKIKFILILFLSFFFSLIFGQSQIGESIIGKAEDDRLGRSVSLNKDGKILAVGSIHHDAGGSNSGQVCIYEQQNNNWIQLGQCINGDSSNDLFGIVVELSSDGSTLVVGALNQDSIGYVKIFEFVNNSWIQKGSILYGDQINDSFGFAVSISGDGKTVIVGARESNSNGLRAGLVKVFRLIGNDWTQIGNTFLGEEFDLLGWSVSISSSGDTIAFGAREFNTKIGRAEVYYLQEESWNQIGENIYGSNMDRFGNSIAISSDGRIVSIGARDRDNGKGLIHTVKLENDIYVKMGNDIVGNSEYGYLSWDIDLSSDGLTIITTAPYHYSNNEDVKESSMALFKFIDNEWVKEFEILGKENEDLIVDVSLSENGEIFALGATGTDDNGERSGSAKVYRVNSSTAVKEDIQRDLIIYPNPANDKILLSNHSFIDASFIIADMNGVQVLTGKVNKDIPISKLQNGIYILRVHENGLVYKSKIVKIKY